MRTNTTLVINSKGGSGKTTVTTNLASYFAANNIPTAIMDYDLQGSCLNWLRLRGPFAAKIHGANAAHQRNGLRSVGMHVPEHVTQLIIDAPAGAYGLLLQEMLSRAHCIIVPVQPSAIDIHATANFIRDLLLTGRIRSRNVRLAVVANRIRRSTPVYQPLERFLKSLSVPFVARLGDSEAYVKAAETGVGVFEMDDSAAAAEREQFMPIVKWVDTKSVEAEPKPAVGAKVIDIGRRSLPALGLR
jgi:chromosome partitioning protein